MVTNINGTMINFAAAVVLMDADICERLNAELAPCTDQEFFAAYEAVHQASIRKPPRPGRRPGNHEAINSEYEQAQQRLKDAHNAQADEHHKTTETAAEFIEIINILIKSQHGGHHYDHAAYFLGRGGIEGMYLSQAHLSAHGNRHAGRRHRRSCRLHRAAAGK